MREFYTIEFPESSVSEVGYNDPVYKASEILRAYSDIDELQDRDGVSLGEIFRCLLKSVVAITPEMENAFVMDVVVSGNKINFCVVDNYSTVEIGSLLAKELGKDLTVTFQRVYDNGVCAKPVIYICPGQGHSTAVYNNDAAVEPKRFIVERPSWEFYDSIEESLKEARNAGFHLDVIEEGENGILVSILDRKGLMNGMRMRNPTMFESHDFIDPEHSVLAGPYPVLDPELLYDRLFYTLNGVDEVYKIPTSADEVMSLSYGEIQKLFNEKYPSLMNNFSEDDLRDAIDDLRNTVDGLCYNSNISVNDFCLCLKNHVEERMQMYSNIKTLDRFVSQKTRNACLYEQVFIECVSDLKGLKPCKNAANGVRVASVDGYEVFVKERSGGADKLYEKYVSLKRNGESVGFVNAVRDGSLDGYDFLGKVFSEAKSKDKSVRLYERIMNRFRFISKKGHGKGINH